MKILYLNLVSLLKIFYVSKGVLSSVVTFDLHPTAELSVSNESHRRRLAESKEWEYKSGVYGALEYFSSKNDSYKEEFDKERQFSRYERHSQEQRRRLEESGLQNGSLYSSHNNLYQLTPLYQGYGTHYSTVWVGTPPQRKSVIVDTGSHFTAFPCVGCQNCGEEHHTDKYFDPDKSATFHALSCNECESITCDHSGKCVFSQSYTEGSSWSAYQVRDRFFCGKRDSPSDVIDNSFSIPFMFGCQTSETGLFVTQLADGIMGMSAHSATLPQKMTDLKVLDHNMFSLCFKRELTVSKEGVTAGLLTLGGVDTRLQRSPMVYAKNKVNQGWYTVYVKNIYLRKGGGMSAKLNSLGRDDEIIHLPMNVKAVNSGKGVIVDSGTTDTYLSKSIEKGFLESWKAFTGMTYSNSALKLTKEQIKKLPTLLIQLEAFDEMGNFELMSHMDQQSGNNVVGLVGSLDVTSPRDVLLAVPAEHFFEYSPSRDTYTSRLYFTETSGGVLGANAMQGHDVLFDWENSRIGFAESSCDYAEIMNDLEQNPNAVANQLTNDGQPPAPDPDEGSDVSLDCILSPPTIKVSCEESVENAKDKCLGMNPNTYVDGALQHLKFIVQNPGSGRGKSCKDVARAMMPGTGSVSCYGEGTCSMIQSCELKCKDLEDKKLKPQIVLSDGGLSKLNNCMDDSWGACTAYCSQSRMRSARMEDGSCRAVSSESRPCHIDACGSHNSCRVPFVVHAVIGLDGVNANLWTKKYEEIFVEAFASAIGGLGNIGPGDIDVLMTNVWNSEHDSVKPHDERILGLRLILEISMFSDFSDYQTENMKDSVVVLEESNTEGEGEGEDPESATKCGGEERIFHLAKRALELQNTLQNPSFVTKLLNRLPRPQSDQIQSPFALAYTQTSVENSRVISSWTIKTDSGAVHKHESEKPQVSTSQVIKEKVQRNITNVPLITSFLFVIAIIYVMINRLQYKMNERRDDLLSGTRKTSTRVRQRMSSIRGKSKYSEVGVSKETDTIGIELA